MKLPCLKCFLADYCIKDSVELVNDVELDSPDFIKPLRNFISTLPISDTHWREYLHDLNRDLDVSIVQGGVWRIELDLSVFDYTDEDIDRDNAKAFETNLRHWFQEVIKPVPTNVRPHITVANKEKYRVFFTLIIATYRNFEFFRIIRRNDNTFASNDNDCPKK